MRIEMRLHKPKLPAIPANQDILKSIWIAALVVVATFPQIDLAYSYGIDPPLAWAFNYIFKQGLQLGSDIIFPHGPLAFLTYPLQENIVLAVIVTSLLKGMLTFLAIALAAGFGNKKWMVGFVSAWVLCSFAGFTFLIPINILLCYLLYYDHKTGFYKYAGIALTVLAFYVRANLAIVSGLVTISFLAYHAVTEKRYKTLLKDSLIWLALLIAAWIIMYRTPAGFVRYCYGVFNLVQDNSSAAAYYPPNNWLLLIPALAIIFALPFWKQTNKGIYFGILTALSLFAVWKHSMAREEVFHARGLFVYAGMLMLLFVVYLRNFRFHLFIPIVLALMLLYANLRNTMNYEPICYELLGVNNFSEFTTGLGELKQKANDKTKQNLACNILPQMVKDSIGLASIDVYPWDYSIIAVNQMNWQPRPVIQSYAAYTHWLDMQNADHFASAKAPAFIIWDIDKQHANLNGSTLESIDNRWLLNDEPQTLMQILKHYQLVYHDRKFLVYRKRYQPLKTQTETSGSIHTKWDQWISVPNHHASVTRAKVVFKKGLLQRLKSFFYKDEQFYVYYKFADGTIHAYRIVPKNAADGVWINPYILDPSTSNTDPEVKSISFKCSNQWLVPSDIEIKWEYTCFAECTPRQYPLSFFAKTSTPNDTLLLHSENGFEKPASTLWSPLPAEAITTHPSYTGTRSHVVWPGSFSVNFSMSLDSFPATELNIATDLWIRADSYNYSGKIVLIATVVNHETSSLWTGVGAEEQIIDPKSWNHVLNHIRYVNNTNGCTLKVYVWNQSSKNIFIDDFRVMVKESKPVTK